MDLTPAQIVHYLLSGDWEPILPWQPIRACVHCEMCTARRQQQVNSCKLFHFPRAMARRSGRVAPAQAIATCFRFLLVEGSLCER